METLPGEGFAGRAMVHKWSKLARMFAHDSIDTDPPKHRPGHREIPDVGERPETHPRVQDHGRSGTKQECGERDEFSALRYETEGRTAASDTGGAF